MAKIETDESLGSKERAAAERIMITGATGFLGWQVFLCLYRRCGDARFCLPVRGRRGQGADKRVAALVAHSFPPEERKKVLERIEVVAADLTQEKLGLSADAYERHARESTRIIHVAAKVQREHVKAARDMEKFLYVNRHDAALLVAEMAT